MMEYKIGFDTSRQFVCGCVEGKECRGGDFKTTDINYAFRCMNKKEQSFSEIYYIKWTENV